jgi:hypothetical protein
LRAVRQKEMVEVEPLHGPDLCIIGFSNGHVATSRLD